MAKHLENTHPTINFTALTGGPDPLTLDNLNELNKLGGEDIFLSSIEDVTTLPKFLHGQEPNQVTYRTDNAKSCVVIVVDKGDGIIDAFYMYWYIFNDGPSALGHQVGNHLGDWYAALIHLSNCPLTTPQGTQHGAIPKRHTNSSLVLPARIRLRIHLLCRPKNRQATRLFQRQRVPCKLRSSR